MRSPSLKRSVLAFRHLLLRLMLGGTVLLLSLLFYACQIEPGWVEIVPVRMVLPNLAADFEGYRIVQLSDIHMDDWMTEQRLRKIVHLVNQQQPDLVALTGDFITAGAEPKLKALTKGLQDLQPKDFTAAVLGNHDHADGKPNSVREALSDAGVVNLKNEVQTIRRNESALNIAGVDDYWMKQDDLGAVLKQLTVKGTTILLVHEPDYADKSSATGQFDLELSGHSHGGQVTLPLIGALQLPPYGKKYPAGQYQVGSMIQYTNRGVGMVSPKVRFNCRPEVTVITLKTGKQKKGNTKN